jgi:hypothetical protein
MSYWRNPVYSFPALRVEAAGYSGVSVYISLQNGLINKLINK